MGEWYYARNTERFGPVSIDQLKQLIVSGQLGPNDLVWKDGMANWAPASTIPGLFVAAAPPPPPPTRTSAPAPVVATPKAAPGPPRPMPPIVALALVIAKRAVADNLDTLPVTNDEKTQLSAASLSGETAQRYLVWRRSLLWFALVPMGLSALGLLINDLVYTFDHLASLGVVLQSLRILTLLALPAATVLAALTWNKPGTSTRIVLFGLLICFGVPSLFEILPPAWTVDKPDVWTGGLLPLSFALSINLLSLFPGLLRGSVRVRTLLPESTVTGILLVGAALFTSLVFLLVLPALGSRWFTTGFLGLAFILCVCLAPLCYVIAAKTFLRPITPADYKSISLWQWIYYGLCVAAGLIVIAQMFATDEKVGFYGFWMGLLLFLDFLGRSLYVSVAAAQAVLYLSREAIVTQQQFATSEQGNALNRRLSEMATFANKI